MMARLPVMVIVLLFVPLLFMAQRWSFELYRIGFVLLWPIMICEIIVSNAGVRPSLGSIARVTVVVAVTIAVLSGVAMLLTPSMASLGTG